MADAIGFFTSAGVAVNKLSTGMADMIVNPIFVKINQIEFAPIEVILFQTADPDISLFVSTATDVIGVPILQEKPKTASDILEDLTLPNDRIDVTLHHQNGNVHHDYLYIYYYVYNHALYGVVPRPSNFKSSSYRSIDTVKYRSDKEILITKNEIVGH